ncbi:Diaminopimelate epimerase [Candidatus Lokiarchaeum ossiferum]|uniref:Diaminopimelate epimerase n=1 Tax=Candidatus Lokiarchaeum ossiferum TaxID=2951803 RepID=A0ABY6HPA9_9ARCH|nr:Diaminopimelate epimerase [Candidatus Lokiarchaeum sp. B-35]
MTSQPIPFIKMHGIGNDYVYINTFDFSVNKIDLPDLAQKISHRHYGIGGDGLVLICPSIKVEIKMRMFNSDGSEAEMCGNAVRCVAGYAFENNLVSQRKFNIETLAGIIGIEMFENTMVRVDMGCPILESINIPVHIDSETVVDHPISTSHFKGRFTAVSMGNPHAVYVVTDVNSLNLELIGPALETHAYFPNRINSEFIEIISPEEINLRVWERGAGETWACGTGAAAAITAGNLLGLLDKKVLIHLKGGDLILETTESLDRVWKTGPYSMVSTGFFYYNSSDLPSQNTQKGEQITC